MNRTLLLLGSLGLGAGVAYMLAPDRGERRRALVPARAQAYRRWTEDLGSLQRSLGRTARGLSHQARDILGQTRMPQRYERVWRASRPARAGQTEISKGLLMLGWLGLGMGLMYMLDPSAGRRRRALVRDKAWSYWSTTESVVGKKARDMQNRTRGMIAGARQRFRETDVPEDTVLEARVRAQIGHVISHAGAIGVTARQGRVSLSGPVPANEVEKLLSTVASVPGVTEVVNQLEVHTDTTHISGLQDDNRSN